MNASDPKQVEASDKRAKRRREQELRDFKAIIGTREGRRYVWGLLCLCHVFESSWEASAKIHFNEGERNIGLKLLKDINDGAPAAYQLMLAEAAEDKEKEKQNG